MSQPSKTRLERFLQGLPLRLRSSRSRDVHRAQSTSESFSYGERLDRREIRLIKLEPGDGHEQLKCSLVRRPLDSAPKFIALSYAWGDQTRTRQLLCDGVPHNITTNLFEALEHIRKMSFNYILWADALCINQNDDIEKTSQVRMMKDIYSTADQVIIWLGKEDATDRRGYELAHQLSITISDGRHINTNALKQMMQSTTFALDARFEDLLLSQSEEGWVGLGNLFKQPWFSRVWIIQELMAARTTRMIRGDFQMETAVVLNAGFIAHIIPQLRYYLFDRPDGIGPILMRNMGCVNMLGAMYSGMWTAGDSSPLSLLKLTTSFQATDLRDRVFALIGITPHLDQDVIDYHKDTTSINMEITRVLVDQSLIVDILDWKMVVGIDSNGPSWAPRWTHGNPTPGGTMSSMTTRIESQDYGVESYRVESDRVLIIRGNRLDTIKKIIDGPHLPTLDTISQLMSTDMVQEICSREYEWIQRIFSHFPSTIYLSGGPVKEVIARTLALDGSFHEPRDPLDYGAALDDLMDLLKSQNAGHQAEKEDSTGYFIEKCFSRAHIMYCIALTSKGHLAWVPKDSLIGDSIVSFDGGHIPYVLRVCSDPKEESQPAPNQETYTTPQEWILVGSSYVHGWTDPLLFPPSELLGEEIRII